MLVPVSTARGGGVSASLRVSAAPDLYLTNQATFTTGTRPPDLTAETGPHRGNRVVRKTT